MSWMVVSWTQFIDIQELTDINITSSREGKHWQKYIGGAQCSDDVTMKSLVLKYNDETLRGLKPSDPLPTPTLKFKKNKTEKSTTSHLDFSDEIESFKMKPCGFLLWLNYPSVYGLMGLKIKVEQRLKWLELKNKKRYLVSFEFSPFYRSSASSSESTGASLWCLFLFLTTTSSPTAIFICCGCWNNFWKHCHFVQKCN